MTVINTFSTWEAFALLNLASLTEHYLFLDLFVDVSKGPVYGLIEINALTFEFRFALGLFIGWHRKGYANNVYFNLKPTDKLLTEPI